MKDLSQGTPVPDGTYEFEVVKLKEETFSKGSWGFVGQHKVLSGDQENRRVFENYVLIDPEGDLSGAAFRFAQLYEACSGEEVELDGETEEVMDVLRNLAEATVGAVFKGDTEIEDGEAGYRDRAGIVKYHAV
jgi:hypothetical protein